MKLTRGRAVSALTGLLLLALVATAVGIKPKPGLFSTGANEPDHLSVTFTYRDGKLLSFFAATTSCKEGEPAIVEKKIKVKNNGKFAYDGKASSPIGRHFHIDVEGEFVSKKKAKGTADREDCDPIDFTVKFKQAVR